MVSILGHRVAVPHAVDITADVNIHRMTVVMNYYVHDHNCNAFIEKKSDTKRLVMDLINLDCKRNTLELCIKSTTALAFYVLRLIRQITQTTLINTILILHALYLLPHRFANSWSPGHRVTESPGHRVTGSPSHQAVALGKCVKRNFDY